LAEQGQRGEGVVQMHQGLTAYRAMGAEPSWSDLPSLLADAYGKAGQTENGLRLLAEALATVDKRGERWWEAELYRLKGELLLVVPRSLM
jgi:predicted ATPase